MSDPTVNHVLDSGAIGDGDTVPSMSPALASLLTHPVHVHDLRFLVEVREALDIVRADLARAREAPPLPPPDLPAISSILRQLGY